MFGITEDFELDGRVYSFQMCLRDILFLINWNPSSNSKWKAPNVTEVFEYYFEFFVMAQSK